MPVTYVFTTIPGGLSTLLTDSPTVDPPSNMAPIELDSTSSRIPLATIITHILATVYLTALVGRTITRSYFAMPPSQDTRLREPSRKRQVKTFLALVGASFLLASYHAYTFSRLSYRVWATERGVDVPNSIFGSEGVLGNDSKRLHITRWLNDTPLYRDSLEIVAEKARRFWWEQQLNLSTLSWSIFLAAEGQRRNIPHRWAFMMLAQLVSVSFAQNLFYLAILLTPVPLPENVKDLTRSSMPATSSRMSQLKKKVITKKPTNWVPHPALYYFPLLWSLCTTFLIPLSSNTPSFMTIIILSKALTFTPLFLPYIVPTSWGTIQTYPHSSHNLYTTLFKTISIVSTLLHGKETLRALLYNTPASHYHRHSLLHPFKTERRSLLDRSTTAVGKILGAVGDHPVVAGVGWDVLMSGLSLGVWSAIRGLDVHDIFASSVPFYKRVERTAEDVRNGIKSEVEKTTSTAVKATDETPVPRKRGRPRKTDAVLPESPTVLKRSTRSKRASTSEEANSPNSSYVPSEVVHSEGHEEVPDEWEIAALAWGMISTMGLGAASAGIFGAETIAR